MIADKRTTAWAPAELIVVVGGIRMAEFADGDMVTFTPGAPVASMTVGTDGHAGMNWSPRRDGEVSMRFLAGSASNDVLQALVNTQAYFMLMIYDLNGRSLIECAAATVSAMPDRAWGPEMGVCEWKFLGNNWLINNGGSNRVGLG